MDSITIYRILVITLFAFAAIIFFSLLVIPAPYGRHVRKGWGYTVRAKIGWLVMELPAFLVIIFMFFLGERKESLVAIVFLLMWTTHYFQRTFIFPFLMKGGEKKFPVVLIVFALIFNSINGFANGKYLFQLAPAYGISWFYDPRFVIGALFFIAGMTINLHSDHILRILRKSPDNGYKIPSRGLFKYISCPNYFGEILEWTGWAIATWSIPGLAFAVFTFANLAPRAFTNHKWYKEKFPDYPEKRKALIPFIK
jgi:protein-S-isoprenylcysteine O-methyltransferase Ste14